MSNLMLQCTYSNHDTQNKMIQGICINKDCTWNRTYCSLCLRESFHRDHMEDLLDIQDFEFWVVSIIEKQKKFKTLMFQIETQLKNLTIEINENFLPNKIIHEGLSHENQLFLKIKQQSDSLISINYLQVEQMNISQINEYVSLIIKIRATYNQKTIKISIINQSLSTIIKKVKKIKSFQGKLKKQPEINQKADLILKYEQNEIQGPKVLILKEQKIEYSGFRKPYQRVALELNQCPLDDQTIMFKLFPNKNDIAQVYVIFQGPKYTIFDGGIYKLLFQYTSKYPFKPPTIIVNTQIYHPNIKGPKISLDILSDQWSPRLTIEKTILSIISFLDDPNPEDPLDFESAALYKKDRLAYNKKVQEYKLKYSSPTVDELLEYIFGNIRVDDPDYIFVKKNLIEWIEYWKNFQK